MCTAPTKSFCAHIWICTQQRMRGCHKKHRSLDIITSPTKIISKGYSKTNQLPTQCAVLNVTGFCMLTACVFSFATATQRNATKRATSERANERTNERTNEPRKRTTLQRSLRVLHVQAVPVTPQTSILNNALFIPRLQSFRAT